MKTVEIAELKDGLSELLRAVERGVVPELVVIDRDRPIARILPIERPAARVLIQPPKVPFSSVRGLRFKPARWPISSLDLLLEDRGVR
jgi:antitoxin (DNA-binding transcriptional repressor) of toxin-antitoxin stability system